MPCAKRPPEPCTETIPLPFEPLIVRVSVAVRLTGIGGSKLLPIATHGARLPPGRLALGAGQEPEAMLS